jgi:hypothetical protein
MALHAQQRLRRRPVTASTDGRPRVRLRRRPGVPPARPLHFRRGLLGLVGSRFSSELDLLRGAASLDHLIQLQRPVIRAGPPMLVRFVVNTRNVRKWVIGRLEPPRSGRTRVTVRVCRSGMVSRVMVTRVPSGPRSTVISSPVAEWSRVSSWYLNWASPVTDVVEKTTPAGRATPPVPDPYRAGSERSCPIPRCTLLGRTPSSTDHCTDISTRSGRSRLLLPVAGR